MVSNGDEESSAHIPENTKNSSFFRYNSPLVQVILIGFVCFCCPGMLNALSGMGGGGQLDHTASNNSLTALYTIFAIFGILGGGIYNVLGPHFTLFAGCSTFVLYTSSFLYYNHYHHQAFAIVTGALLGVGAGLLWAAQGAIMTCYPPSNRKASKVVRDDGSKCTNILYSNVSTECLEILKLFFNWKMLLLVPAAWSSNFFYPYQFNNVNGVLFNLRTRGLNSVCYWGAQMLGSVGIGYIMDFSFKSRRVRGLVGIGVVAIIGSVIWGGALANQLSYSSNDLPEKLDFKYSGSHFAGPFVLYFCFGLLDAIFQSMVYWVIGALADDSEILSRYTGFYKGIQSAGAAVAWQVDEHKVSFMSQLIVNWVLTSISYPLLFVLVILAVKEDINSVT
ncbi:UNC93-like protein 1 [Abrus precatorius]|uniref:UNC93-like protein 1 n=1 Tax=Abrus precatorius TaxID=3816 RepID=A0A8B8MI75_ABRPR|nr:UNC93-like protein 1 [Abrus precatorius]